MGIIGGKDTGARVLSPDEREEYRGILKSCFESAAAFDGQEHNAVNFYRAVNMIDVFVKARNDGKISPDLEAEFAKQAGYNTSDTLNNVMEDAAENAYGMLSRFKELDEIIDILKMKGALIDLSNLVYVLTDQPFPSEGEGEQPVDLTGFRQQPRLSLLVEGLESIGVYTDDIIIRVG